MNTCPCCSNKLLRHIRSSNTYWFCSHCRQEMPNLDGAIALSNQIHKPRREINISPLELPLEAIAFSQVKSNSQKEPVLAVEVE